MPRIKKNSNQPVKHLTIEIEQDIFAELEKHCKVNNCTKSFFVREMIKSELKKNYDRMTEFLKR